MNFSINDMLEYCSGIAKEFEARLNRIRHYVPNHYLTSGTANELILRDFLDGLSAKRYGVGQGFICNPTNSSCVSKQCDILVYDQATYPLVYSEGDVKVVFPESVRMLIESKTKLDQPKLWDALENINIAKQMNSQINGVIFAFTSTQVESVVANLREYPIELPMKHAPIAILLLDQGAILHRYYGGTLSGGGSEAYEVRLCKKGENATVMAFLLLLFFDAQLLGVYGGASVENMLRKILVDRTDLLLNNLQIGVDS